MMFLATVPWHWCRDSIRRLALTLHTCTTEPGLYAVRAPLRQRPPELTRRGSEWAVIGGGSAWTWAVRLRT